MCEHVLLYRAISSLTHQRTMLVYVSQVGVSVARSNPQP